MKQAGIIFIIVIALAVFYLLFIVNPKTTEAPMPEFQGPNSTPFVIGPTEPPPGE